MTSLLYPISNKYRTEHKLDGLWDFRFDPEKKGEKENWAGGLPDGEGKMKMPVPASFSDFFTDEESRDYCGSFWYETEFFVSENEKGRDLRLRFGSATHRAKVFVNGQKVGCHEGGFLPFVCDISEAVRYGEKNRLVVKVNNELDETTLPCGAVTPLRDGRKLVKPYFDFFNYSGIHRSVWLMSVPKTEIADYEVVTGLHDDSAEVGISVYIDGHDESDYSIKAELFDGDESVAEETTIAERNVTGVTPYSAQITLNVNEPKLWDIYMPNLYVLRLSVLDGDIVLDSYEDKIGLRTFEVEGEKLLLNGKQVYLKGFGKHEDFDVIGRGFSYAVAKRDFECMKWIGANCFRTSHYPYAEEWYRFADEEGFLIIDEVPAVGMMRSFVNFVDAGSGKYTSFFESDTVPQLQQNHLQAVREMILRDKNHPSVIAWSLFNEPETISEAAYNYFNPVFEEAIKLDPQKRPRTGALEKTSSPEKCHCHVLCDFICLNRYYGWYISGGTEIGDAREQFIEEMNAWRDKKLNKPFVFTEFGADTLATEHRLPSVMWSQEYQKKYYEMNFEIFDRYDFVQGELTWNFADFQTSEGIFRVGGNKKGVFTRNRQPKDAAFIFKERWCK